MSNLAIGATRTYDESGTLIDKNVYAHGVYFALRHGVVGYSERTNTAPSEVTVTLNGVSQSEVMAEHPDYSGISFAEVTLPIGRPLGVRVQGREFLVYRTNSLSEAVDQSAEASSGYDVTLTTEAHTQVRSFAFQAANALNNGSAWADIKAPSPPKAPVGLVKQDLVGFTKMSWAEADTVKAGDILSHDNGTTRGLWRAQTATTAEPAQGHSDWTLVFEITV